MEFDSDILIVGGGLNGCALALALVSGGQSVTVIDRLAVKTSRLPDFDGRAYALALASVRALTAIALWPEIAGTAQPMREIKVTDGRPGEGPAPFWMHFDHAEIAEGPLGHMVEDRHLRRAFLDAMQKSRQINYLPGEDVVTQDIAPNHVRVTLASGKRLTGRLLVGCDGRQSGTAERAGIGRKIKEYGQTALVAAIGHDLPHNGIAHQFFMPAGPLAILPLTGNRCSVVWAESHARAREIAAMDDVDFIAALRPGFGDFLGPLHVAGARFSYPLAQTIADRLTGPRLALVGDAAHGVHPLAGQGLNQGLRDMAALSEIVVDAARRGEDIGSDAVLSRYAEWRRFDANALAMATDGFNTLFSNDNPILRLGRDIGMGLVGAVPALRRTVMREAAGLTGDLPRLMKGRPL